MPHPHSPHSPHPPESIEPLDRGRVDLTDPNEAEYWCQEFGCSEMELRAAIDRVGNHTGAVREALHEPPQVIHKS